MGHTAEFAAGSWIVQQPPSMIRMKATSPLPEQPITSIILDLLITA